METLFFIFIIIILILGMIYTQLNKPKENKEDIEEVEYKLDHKKPKENMETSLENVFRRDQKMYYDDKLKKYTSNCKETEFVKLKSNNKQLEFINTCNNFGSAPNVGESETYKWTQHRNFDRMSDSQLEKKRQEEIEKIRLEQEKLKQQQEERKLQEQKEAERQKLLEKSSTEEVKTKDVCDFFTGSKIVENFKSGDFTPMDKTDYTQAINTCKYLNKSLKGVTITDADSREQVITKLRQIPEFIKQIRSEDGSEDDKGCGYCYKEGGVGEIIYGDSLGPYKNAGTGNACKLWIKPGDIERGGGLDFKSNKWRSADDPQKLEFGGNQGVVDDAIKLHEQEICSRVAHCGDLDGEKSICGWCYMGRKGDGKGEGMVARVDPATGEKTGETKYMDDYCPWPGEVSSSGEITDIWTGPGTTSKWLEKAKKDQPKMTDQELKDLELRLRNEDRIKLQGKKNDRSLTQVQLNQTNNMLSDVKNIINSITRKPANNRKDKSSMFGKSIKHRYDEDDVVASGKESKNNKMLYQCVDDKDKRVKKGVNWYEKKDEVRPIYFLYSYYDLSEEQKVILEALHETHEFYKKCERNMDVLGDEQDDGLVRQCNEFHTILNRPENIQFKQFFMTLDLSKEKVGCMENCKGSGNNDLGKCTPVNMEDIRVVVGYDHQRVPPAPESPKTRSNDRCCESGKCDYDAVKNTGCIGCPGGKNVSKEDCKLYAKQTELPFKEGWVSYGLPLGCSTDGANVWYVESGKYDHIPNRQHLINRANYYDRLEKRYNRYYRYYNWWKSRYERYKNNAYNGYKKAYWWRRWRYYSRFIRYNSYYLYYKRKSDNWERRFKWANAVAAGLASWKSGKEFPNNNRSNWKSVCSVKKPDRFLPNASTNSMESEPGKNSGFKIENIDSFQSLVVEWLTAEYYNENSKRKKDEKYKETIKKIWNRFFVILKEKKPTLFNKNIKLKTQRSMVSNNAMQSGDHLNMMKPYETDELKIWRKETINPPAKISNPVSCSSEPSKVIDVTESSLESAWQPRKGSRLMLANKECAALEERFPCFVNWMGRKDISGAMPGCACYKSDKPLGHNNKCYNEMWRNQTTLNHKTKVHGQSCAELGDPDLKKQFSKPFQMKQNSNKMENLIPYTVEVWDKTDIPTVKQDIQGVRKTADTSKQYSPVYDEDKPVAGQVINSAKLMTLACYNEEPDIPDPNDSKKKMPYSCDNRFRNKEFNFPRPRECTDYYWKKHTIDAKGATKQDIKSWNAAGRKKTLTGENNPDYDKYHLLHKGYDSYPAKNNSSLRHVWAFNNINKLEDFIHYEWDNKKLNSELKNAMNYIDNFNQNRATGIQYDSYLFLKKIIFERLSVKEDLIWEDLDENTGEGQKVWASGAVGGLGNKGWVKMCWGDFKDALRIEDSKVKVNLDGTLNISQSPLKKIIDGPGMGNIFQGEPVDKLMRNVLKTPDKIDFNKKLGKRFNSGGDIKFDPQFPDTITKELYLKTWFPFWRFFGNKVKYYRKNDYQANERKQHRNTKKVNKANYSIEYNGIPLVGDPSRTKKSEGKKGQSLIKIDLKHNLNGKKVDNGIKIKSINFSGVKLHDQGWGNASYVTLYCGKGTTKKKLKTISIPRSKSLQKKNITWKKTAGINGINWIGIEPYRTSGGHRCFYGGFDRVNITYSLNDNDNPDDRKWEDKSVKLDINTELGGN